MSTISYIAIFIILFVIGILYKRWQRKDFIQQRIDDYDYIKNYLLNESTLAKCKKPILWIPIQFEYNSRHWLSWGSRSSTCLNKPYITLCIKSIIEHCGEDFQICLIDDVSFNKIIPGWSTKVENLPSPLSDHLRNLALCKVLYYYGGMVIPPSLICLKSLYSIYNMGTLQTSMFSGELIPESNISSNSNFFPSLKIMGCVKDSNIMKEFISYLETLISSDYTEQMEFTGAPERWIFKQSRKNKILIINGDYFGVKDKNSNIVNLDILMGNFSPSFSKNMISLYVPENNLTKRTNYNWFERCSYEQVLESETIIGKYLLLSN
jgi:hypothetical protein